jgi:hypothetical protein
MRGENRKNDKCQVRSDVKTMPLTLQFTLTTDEFMSGQRVFNRLLAPPMARFNYRYAVSVGVLLMVEGAVSLALRWNSLLSLFVFVFGAYLVLFRTIIGPGRAKKEFTQYPAFFADRTMEFREDKILVQTAHGKSETDWARFTRFVETDKLFVLFAPPRFLYMIPKRVVSSNDFDRFRAVLRRKLPGHNGN